MRNVLLSTLGCPEGLPIRGTGGLVESRVVRVKKKGVAGEGHANDVSSIVLEEGGCG